MASTGLMLSEKSKSQKTLEHADLNLAEFNGSPVCSLQPIGEAPSSGNYFQAELNRLIEDFNAIIQDIAQKENVAYIAVHEALRAQIAASPGREFTSFSFLSLYRDAFRVLVLRKTPDEIALLNGWRFHTDGVHLNSRGGTIVTDLVQGFIQDH